MNVPTYSTHDIYLAISPLIMTVLFRITKNFHPKPFNRSEKNINLM